VRDFFGREAAHLTKCQRDLGVWWKRRVAARKDQPQPIVFERLLFGGDWIDGRLQLLRELGDGRIEARAPAENIDRLEAASRHKPRERVAW
jgi:hypothetical protein